MILSSIEFLCRGQLEILSSSPSGSLNTEAKIKKEMHVLQICMKLPPAFDNLSELPGSLDGLLEKDCGLHMNSERTNA